jgi:AraC-like DNA-binding protein
VSPPRLLVVSTRVEALVALRCLLAGSFAVEAVSAMPQLLLALAAGAPGAVVLATGPPTGRDGLAAILRALPVECPLLVLTEREPDEALAALAGTSVAGVFPPRQLGGLLRSLDCLFERRSPVFSWPVRSAIATVIAGWSERLSVRELAMKVGVSDGHLAHRFRSELGISVRQLLLEVRIEKAVKLLVETDHTVQRVARLSGFTDAPHLCRTLARHRGRRPGDVRCEHWRAPRSPHRPAQGARG